MSGYQRFNDFYKFYLSEHSNQSCRRLHFIGTALVLLVFALMLFSVVPWSRWWLLPIIGYGFAWVGHFFFEKNRPATFRHPLYSFLADWLMFWQILIGKIKF